MECTGNNSLGRPATQPNYQCYLLYYLQLDRLYSNLVATQPGLMNRRGVILHHHEARPYAAVITRQKLLCFGREVLFHPPYSADLAQIDYHLFRMLNNSFSQKIFDGIDAVKTAIKDFFDSKPQEFFCRGIHLPERWQKITNSYEDCAQ